MKQLIVPPSIRAGLLAAMLGLLGAGATETASAQAMRDPTRPPAQFLDPADAAEAATPPVSGLQTIKLTGKRRIALLNGDWLKPGDRSGEAVVEKIDDHSIVLKYQDGRRETIRMYPEVEMQSSKAVRRTAGK
jgi:MSHA biogenesis protein MshK